MRFEVPALDTPRLRLRAFGIGDRAALIALHTDREVLRYWDSPPWTGAAQADRFLERCRSLAAEGTGLRWAVERSEDGGFLGWCGLSRWTPEHRSAALTYCFRREAWGWGVATEAVTAVLGWAYGALDLHRVQAETDTRNAASLRVLDKLGFVREGTLREDCVVDGEVSDTAVLGLLRPDWHPGG